MKSIIASMCSAAVFSIAAVGAAQSSPPVDSSTDSVEIVVDFVDGTSASQMQAAGAHQGIALRPNSFLSTEDGVEIATVPRDRVNDVLAALRARSDVQSAGENGRMQAFLTPNDPGLKEQWHMDRVGGPSVWNQTCGQGVIVAVVDTGVACENYGPFTRVRDLDGTHCLQGYNFVSDTNHPNDDQGHGTHVAGTIAQTTNNNFGGAGVAYCSSVLPVKVLDGRGGGSFADVAEGIRWAADQGARVINLSLGGGGGRSIPVVADAVAYARKQGALVVCAAGNNGRVVESPAREPGATAVSAIDPGDQIASFSSRGPEVKIAAPGVLVYQQTICNGGKNKCEEFAKWSGTSMAAPHVAGVAALVFSMGVTRVDEVERILLETAATPKHGDENPTLYGSGIVNAAAAIRAIVRKQVTYRALAALAILALVALRIRMRQGRFASAKIWLIPAVATSIGLFFLPWLLPHTLPGMDYLMRPVGDWSLLWSQGLHRWLPLANFAVIGGLVSLSFGRPWLRAVTGGAALGTGAYLLATVALRFHDFPLSNTFGAVWCILNAIPCIWVARIGLDESTG